MINGHGNDAYKYQGKIVADFSSNIAGEVSHELEQYLSSCIKKISNYPEPDAKSLKNKLAVLHKLTENNITITNGSTEAFYMLAQVLNKRQSVIVVPSFSEYEDACKAHNHKIQYLSNKDLNSDSKFDADAVWLGNPNNPDGKIFSIEIIEKLCGQNRNAIFIIDEAYAELCAGFTSAIPLINTFENLIIVKSLTKAFSIPGLRLGYVVSGIRNTKKLESVKIPWSANSLAIEAGKYIVDNYRDLLQSIDSLLNKSKTLQQNLAAIEGVEVTESNCNFFLVKLKYGNVGDLKDFLIKNYGLLIRDASNFRGLDEKYFRISAQNDKYNEELIRAIKNWISG